MATAPGVIRQAAAIPVRDGQLCLVTSSSGKRWVIPKGCMEPGKTSGEIALQEAWEEAGLVGLLQPAPVGTYLYDKAGFTHHVLVFVMRVTREAEEWPEMAYRERLWLPAAQAVARVEDAGLRDLMRAAVLYRRAE